MSVNSTENTFNTVRIDATPMSQAAADIRHDALKMAGATHAMGGDPMESRYLNRNFVRMTGALLAGAALISCSPNKADVVGNALVGGAAGALLADALADIGKESKCTAEHLRLQSQLQILDLEGNKSHKQAVARTALSAQERIVSRVHEYTSAAKIAKFVAAIGIGVAVAGHFCFSRDDQRGAAEAMGLTLMGGSMLYAGWNMWNKEAMQNANTLEAEAILRA